MGRSKKKWCGSWAMGPWPARKARKAQLIGPRPSPCYAQGRWVGRTIPPRVNHRPGMLAGVSSEKVTWPADARAIPGATTLPTPDGSTARYLASGANTDTTGIGPRSVPLFPQTCRLTLSVPPPSLSLSADYTVSICPSHFSLTADRHRPLVPDSARPDKRKPKRARSTGRPAILH